MTTIVVVDTETTGVDETDQVVEVAVARIDSETRAPSRRHWRWTSLIRPTVPIKPEGRAAHHISDEMLLRAPTMAQTLKVLGKQLIVDGSDDVFAAHNAEFDRRMLLQSGVPQEFLPARTICTYRCAVHSWPDAPKYSNQVLRYWLGLEIPDLPSLPPHRALPDAIVTAAILCKLLEKHSVDELVKVTESPLLLATCKMGDKYRDNPTPWSQVDKGFLRWIVDKGPKRVLPSGATTGFDEDTLHTARYWLEH